MTRTARTVVPVLVLVGALLPATAAAAATRSTTTVRTAATVTIASPTTLTAVVKPATATGTVAFSAGGNTLAGCGAATVTSGRATCRTTFTSTAAVTVTARYGGDGTVAASQGSTTVTPAEGTTGQVIGSVGACTRRAGALVGVSYGAWGGPVVRGCDTTPTTGIDLLRTAGFSTAGTAHDGPAFLCRIGHPYWQSGTQYPTAATEACRNTPPADAYWSYWVAARGQNTWTYSSLGAYSHPATAGEVEAWTFGATDIAGTTGQPSFTPNQVRAGLPTT